MVEGCLAAQAALLDSVAAGELELTSLLPADVARMAQLVRTYHDLRLDPADASVIAIAERLGVTQIALVRVLQEPTASLAVSLAQQMCALILRGLGVPAPEADLIAAQASDEIVRQGGGASAR